MPSTRELGGLRGPCTPGDWTAIGPISALERTHEKQDTKGDETHCAPRSPAPAQAAAIPPEVLMLKRLNRAQFTGELTT